MFGGAAGPGAVVGSDEQRLIAAAEGVLMALRRCTPHAAMDELRDAAHRHGVPVSTIALALVDMAARRPADGETPGPAHVAAQQEWATLFGPSAVAA
ncbi:MAG: ANTAR domain-containing protein [Mycolicibacterium cosmeticum]|nr:ANTAR domain-containing protein [Mycolicibacterium cosmeticum]